MKLKWRLGALKNGFRDATAYRVEFLFEIFGAAAVPAAIQWILWYAAFKIGGAQEMGGMTYADAVTYTLTSILFTQVRGGDHDFELQEMIRTGQLSNYLLKPMGVVEFVYLRGFAPRLLTAGICLAIGCLIGPWFGIHPGRMVGAMFLALMGNVIHYQLGAALATTAFLWEEAYGILMVKNMLVSLLSGELIPLNLFPESMSWIWKSTPFYLYVYGPTRYATGHWSHVEFLQQVAMATGWLVFGWLLIKVTWGLGIKRYLSLGG